MKNDGCAICGFDLLRIALCSLSITKHTRQPDDDDDDDVDTTRENAETMCGSLGRARDHVAYAILCAARVDLMCLFDGSPLDWRLYGGGLSDVDR